MREKTIRFNNHPFRFLLYLEWGLLAFALVSTLESPPVRLARRSWERHGPRGGQPLGPLQGGPPHGPPPEWWIHNPLMAIIPLVLFGLMGLYLPARKLPQLGHTLGQILLILIASASVLNGGRIFPLVYLVLVIRGCLMYGLVGRITLTVVAFTLAVTGLLFRLRPLADIGRRLPPRVSDRLTDILMGLQINFIMLFGLSLLLVALLINALLTERQSQHRLQQANQALKKSAQDIEKLAMDQERNRIARDIHDTLGHSLTALNIQLESALKLWEKDPSQAQQFLSNAKRLGSQSLNDVRQSVTTLRQDPLGGDSLESAIARLLQNIQNAPSSTTQTTTITQDIRLNHPLPQNLTVILYRIVQEGLTNIAKHAQASQIQLQLVSSPALVTLILEDNGAGFDLAQARTGFGLQSMRDRAEAIGGTFAIGSNSRTGTRLQVSLPIPQPLS